MSPYCLTGSGYTNDILGNRTWRDNTSGNHAAFYAWDDVNLLPGPQPQYNEVIMEPGSQLFDAHQEQLQVLCGRFGVRRLWLFGSAAKGTWNPEESDIDLLIEFGPRPQGMRAIEQFFGLQRELEALFGRRVDLVEWSAAKNPYFRREAQKHRRELYAA